MSKFSFIIFVYMTGAFNFAQASVSKMTCQVFNNANEQVTKAIRFAASSRASHPLPVVDDKVLYLRWSYYTEPVSLSLVENPDYPWSFPWRMKTLAKGEIGSKIDGKISGSFDLSMIQDGMRLICEQDCNN
ncbi:MAG: hypothetical protein BroJett040_08220 [Oligoflexia bacterium]|nr:MAG: hypothetical protein BroJett040_08220 [Oligoflexia bacterium]